MAINYSLAARLSKPNDKGSEKKIYAAAQYQELIGLAELSAHISSHGSPFSKGTIMGLLTDTVACIRENLLKGNKVQLGDMGAFFVTLSSEGSDSADDFNASMIKGVNVRWSASEEFRTLLNEATFRQVATRELQAQSRKEMRLAVDQVIGTGGTDDDGGNAGGNTGGNNGGQADPGDVTP